MLRTFIKLTNGFISIVICLTLFVAGAYACYCLWDNQQIYAAAENVHEELLLLKPDVASFDELLAINPDVCAWVSLEGTKIDYPVLQGETNLDYVNTDVYGDFALAGSIFLDSRNDSGFTDAYSLLYGHHMERSGMFGDLDKYLEQKFFDKHDTGELLLPDRKYSLKVIACIQTRASENRIFEPYTWKKGIEGLLDYAENESLYFHQEAINGIREKSNDGAKVHILALTTCSEDYTDARTIILTEMSRE